MDLYAEQLVLFLLLFVRVMSVIATAPVFGHVAVPVQVKIAFGLFLAVVLYPVMTAQGVAVDTRLLPMVILAVQESLVGVFIGLAAGMLFAGVRSAGEMIGYDLGFSIATVFDPETGPNNIIGSALYLMVMLVFLLVNGHHYLLQAVVMSYKAVPLGGLSVTAASVQTFITMTAMVFVVALKFAAPVIVASFLVNVAMAILTRVAPQVNVFAVSFPIKIAVGFLVLIASGPVMIVVFKKLLAGFEEQLLTFMQAL